MKFNTWSIKRIKEGKKVLTSRKQRYENDPQVLEIVGPLPWKFIRAFLYEDEGAETPNELQRVINGIFRRVVQDDEMFYVHWLDRFRILSDLGIWKDDFSDLKEHERLAK